MSDEFGSLFDDEPKKIETPPKKIETPPKKSKPKTEKSKPEKKVEDIVVDFDLDKWSEDLAKLGDFKRLIYKAITGETHRGSNKNLDLNLSKKLKDLRRIKELEKENKKIKELLKKLK